ncbi:hypothetical protein [Streptomyces parvus]|uniref:Uncharacterized protein n=1 Tax=Streptomyces parvus TaxID=66428 RepID=A0A7K3S037_9ACTN|nr:hypothetical protein [Streptomyces parvus]NEC20847.1 hypothetical protein [Streptomyces parvus]
MNDTELLYVAILEQWEREPEERGDWADFNEVLPFTELSHFTDYFVEFTRQRTDLHQLIEGMSRTDYRQYVVEQFIEWYVYQIGGVGAGGQAYYGDAYGSAEQAYGGYEGYGDPAHAAQPPQEWPAQEPVAEAPYVSEGAAAVERPEEPPVEKEPVTDPETLRSVAEALEIYASDVAAPGAVTDAHLELLETYGVHVETDLGMPPEHG